MTALAVETIARGGASGRSGKWLSPRPTASTPLLRRLRAGLHVIVTAVCWYHDVVRHAVLRGGKRPTSISVAVPRPGCRDKRPIASATLDA
jgi:hypothetical protein